ncbi:MAG: metallophosphatase family protein [Defluviitaleaceae bacterium]|nr:metallophosphatase family protein [Defluviitaleaceae bacterium]
MKIAVMADIHANIHALNAVLHDCEKECVEKFWLLGDYVDYGAATIPVLNKLKSLRAEHALAGNHDACLFSVHIRPSQTPHGYASYQHTKMQYEKNADSFSWLKDLLPSQIAQGGNTLLVHGTPNDPYWGKFLPTDTSTLQEIISYMEINNHEYLFMGHSHISFMLTLDGRRIINPGSVGQPRNGYPNAQYLIFDDGEIIFKNICYDINAAASEIEAAGLPEYLSKRLFIGK